MTAPDSNTTVLIATILQAPISLGLVTWALSEIVTLGKIVSALKADVNGLSGRMGRLEDR